MRRAGRVLALGVAAALVAAAQEPGAGSAGAAMAEIDAVLARSRQSPAAERPKLFPDLNRLCGAFLDQHGAKADGEQLLKAAGVWIYTAQQLRLEPEVINRRLAQVKGFSNVTPALSQLLRSTHAKLNLRAGAPAPDWTCTDIRDGSTLSLRDLRGKLVLMDFWATWCPPCVALMHDRLRPLHDKYGEDPRFVLVGIGTPWAAAADAERETAEKQRAFAREHGYAWRKVHDAAADAASSYAVESIPHLVLVDEQGEVLVVGGGHAVIDEVERVLAERLGAGAR